MNQVGPTWTIGGRPRWSKKGGKNHFKSIIPLACSWFCKTTQTRHDGLYPFLQAIFTKCNKIIKIIFSLPHLHLSARPISPPPHLAYLSAKREQEREKVHSWKKARNKVISLFSLIVSRPNTSILNQKLKTHPNKKKNKEKAIRKEEEKRKKEEEGQSKQLNLQNLHQTQVYHMQNFISKVGVSNSMP